MIFMQIIGLRLPLIKPGDDLVAILLEAAKGRGGIRDGDVLVIASSAVATAEGRLRKLSDVVASEAARRLAKKTGLDERFVEVVIQEADQVLGTGERSVLTLKDGMLRINSGVDASNAPLGYVVLMPADGDRVADAILKKIERKTGKRVGVILADSHIQPLRLGTVGQAVGVSGIQPVIDCRRQRDLYGRRLRVTFRAIADQLATAAQIVMGEGDERIPAVLIRGLPMRKEGRRISPKVEVKRDVYSGLLGLR